MDRPGMLEIRRLAKYFGPIKAVDDVSFTVPRGEVLGFLGPNGAGKSTTMKMITGFLAPTAGTAVVCGHDIFDAPDRGETMHRLSAGGRARLCRHDAGRVSSTSSPISAAFPATRRSRRIGRVVETIDRRGSASADRVLVQGLQTSRRHCAGVAARSRRADPRRADRRARSQPEIRDAQDHHTRCAPRRRSSSRPICSKKSRRSAAAPSSSPTAASSPTGRRPQLAARSRHHNAVRLGIADGADAGGPGGTGAAARRGGGREGRRTARAMR